jgi:GAF domain-containing protein
MYQASTEASQESIVGSTNIHPVVAGSVPVVRKQMHHLHALGALGAAPCQEAEEVFTRGLDLLVRQLKVDRACLTAQSSLGLEHLWWAVGEGDVLGKRPGALDPNLCFCPQVLVPPNAPLVISDAARDPRWRLHPAWQSLGIRSYLGVPLRRSGRAVGVLSVQHRSARAWKPSHLDLVLVLGQLLGSALETEALRAELTRTQACLDLTAAVVEDQALEDPVTRLATRRYLEIWSQSHLVQARRRQEVIALVAWSLSEVPGRNAGLQQLGRSLRGVDLLVDLGGDRFLMVLPRTSREGVEVTLARVRAILGQVAVGATMWNPLLDPDRSSPTLQPAIRRAQFALAEAVERGLRGEDYGWVAWSILEADRASFLEEAGEW